MKDYIVNEHYFKRWSHDMAYILGFIVADGNLQKNGYYVKIEVKPEDRSILDFVCKEITPDYKIKYSKRGSEVRWYPASKTLHADLMSLGVIPCKTGKEVFPTNMPDCYLWDFIRGYFDGDGSAKDTCIEITCNSKVFLEQLQARINLGYIKTHKMNWLLVIEQQKQLKQFHQKIYNTGSYCLIRKKKRIEYLIEKPDKIGTFSKEEDLY